MQIVRVIRVGHNNVRVLTTQGYSFLMSRDSFKQHVDSLTVVRYGAKNTRLGYPDNHTFLCPTHLLSNTHNPVPFSTMDWNPLKFGIELEFLCPRSNIELLVQRIREQFPFSDFRNSYGHWHPTAWSLTRDGSINSGSGYQGFELVSPPLTRDQFTQLKTVLSIMSELDCFVMKCCGTHIHFSWAHLPTETQRNRLFDEYANWEFFFDRLVSRSRRESNNRYCKSCNDHRYDDRYHKLNVTSWQKHKTIEVRQHQGTLSYSKIIHWIDLLCAWFKYINTEGYREPNTISEAFEMLGVSSEWYLNRIAELSD